jgi:DNA-binding transcriptional LysR family regulator
MNVAISSRTPQQALAALLDRYAPARLLLIGASEFPALSAFKEAHPDTFVAHTAPGALPAELAAQRFDLALVVDCLEHLPKRDGLNLLGGIRNLNASRIAVLAIWRPAAGRKPISFRWRCKPASVSSATIKC